MSDDDIHHDEPDARDERVAALLEVPPLDDLTRRRLVQRALAGAAPAAPARTARFLRVAAVVVGVAVVGGAAALVLRDEGGNGTETAERTAAPTVADAAPTEEPAAAASGDLGDVPGPDSLRKRLAQRASPPATTDTESFDEGAGSAAGLPPACLDTLAQQGAGPPSLVTTAKYRATAAFVVVADAGGEKAFVLDRATCLLIDTVPLG
jgi:hypothetical protein